MGLKAVCPLELHQTNLKIMVSTPRMVVEGRAVPQQTETQATSKAQNSASMARPSLAHLVLSNRVVDPLLALSASSSKTSGTASGASVTLALHTTSSISIRASFNDVSAHST
jgi:hypothetical protein